MLQSAGGRVALPDIIIAAGGLSLVFGEIRSSFAGLEAAWEDQQSKLDGLKLEPGVDQLYFVSYGSNKYVICVAAAGFKVQFGYLEDETGSVSSITSVGMSGLETLNSGCCAIPPQCRRAAVLTQTAVMQAVSCSRGG